MLLRDLDSLFEICGLFRCLDLLEKLYFGGLLRARQRRRRQG